MNRVFVDMDGVIVDFERYMREQGITGDEAKCRPGAYLAMPSIDGALDAVRSLIGMGYEVWIATKPPTGISFAYADKASWVLQYLPELKRRIIITHDKGLLGDAGDYLIDDRPHKASCEQFAGVLIRFATEQFPSWVEVLNKLRRSSRATDLVKKVPPVTSGLTTDPNDPALTRGVDDKPVPQAEKYLVLPEAERAKGFVRPYRDAYKHVGQQPQYPIRPLTIEEDGRYAKYGYVAFEPYPETGSSVTGRFWTQDQLADKGCGTITTMGRALSETYARDPEFYGSTYCVHCKMHRPVADFKWLDGSTVGS